MAVVGVEEPRCQDRPAGNHERICFALKTAGIERAPVASDQGKLPAGYLEELLHHPPLGAEEMGISVHGTVVGNVLRGKLRPWNGAPAGGKTRRISRPQWAQLRARSDLLVCRHPAGTPGDAQGVPQPLSDGMGAQLKKHWARLDRSSFPNLPFGV
eukprot:7943200-Pyramimonas_sp.AAC.1